MRLVIAKNSSYDYEELRPSVFDVLSRLDGGIIGKGARVLIKPNLLTGAKEAQAITTHPLVVRAAAEYVIDRGGKAQVSDSPPLAPFGSVLARCGLKKALSGLPVDVREFKDSRHIPLNNEGRLKGMEIASDALDADVMINLPKLKSHVQMGLTLAVKNLFGTVVGLKKPEWHYRLGEDRELFAELLLNIYKALRPRMNLMDGILGMEGAGPGASGTPRHMGVLLGSDDALSLDMAVCRMLGLPPDSIPVNRVAGKMGLLEDFDIEGRLPKVNDFVMPKESDLLFGPPMSHKFLRQHLTERPVTIKDECKLCKECLKMCPAGAISAVEKRRGGTLKFDYEKCIRCYCCLEICPQGAIRKHEPAVRKVIGRIHALNKGRHTGQAFDCLYTLMLR